jgi:hypothetical protein
MLIVDMSAVKLPGEVKQNLPPECGQPIGTGEDFPTRKQWQGGFQFKM